MLLSRAGTVSLMGVSMLVYHRMIKKSQIKDFGFRRKRKFALPWITILATVPLKQKAPIWWNLQTNLKANKNATLDMLVIFAAKILSAVPAIIALLAKIMICVRSVSKQQTMSMKWKESARRKINVCYRAPSCWTPCEDPLVARNDQ